MSDNYEQPVEPMSRVEDILRGDDTVHPMSRVEALLKELIEAGGGGGGSTVVVTPIQQTGTKIANITVNGVGYDIFAPEGSSGSVITIDPEYQSGTLLATLTIDGTEYYIYAPAGGGGGSNLILDAQIYSLEETQVGVWTDGKPIYQKVIFDTSTDTSGTEVHIDLSSLNIETMVNMWGYFDRNTSDGQSTYYFNMTETPQTPNYWGIAKYQNALKYIAYKIAIYSGTTSKQTFVIYYTKTTDAAGSGGYQAYGFTPIIYSTEEREVGVWVDNKPLYQKTTYFGEISTNANYGLTMDIGVNIVDTVIDMFANAKVSSGAWAVLPYPLPNANYAAYLDGYNKSTDELTIKTGNDRSFVEGYATIYYTKTTDVAGSGSYNTLGVPTVHYSTDEQVIGTWIDGKPIYQKTIQVSNKTCNSTGFEIDMGLTNVKKIIDEKITVYINQYSEEYLLPYYRASTSEEIIPIRYLGSSGVPYLQVRTRGANYGTCSADVTLQYTKTTD